VLYTAIAEKTMQIMEKVELGRHREQDMEDKLERQKAEYQAEIAELRRELEEVRDEEESRGRWGVKG
jgi:predicted RNase H-like nuclease (RuvC/YqgF family)